MTRFCSCIFSLVLLTASVAGAAIDEDYIAHLKRATDLRAKLSSQVSSADHKLCPGIESTDFSTCFRGYVKTVEIEMQIEIGILATAGVQSAIHDKSSDKVKGESVLALIENVETVLEQVHPNQFFVNRYSAVKSGEVDVLKQYQTLEANGFKQSITQILSILDAKILEASTLFRNENAKLRELKERRAALNLLSRTENEIR